jgi:hypothetical protein
LKEAIYIPLGTRCSSCSILDGIFKKRKFALPFDWIDIPIGAIGKFLLLNRVDFFEDYFSPENILQQRSLSDNVWFPHHLTDPSKFEEQLFVLRHKFIRRLERFHEILKGDSDLVFLTTWGHVYNQDAEYYNLIDTISGMIDRYAIFASVNLYDKDCDLGKHINFHVPLGETWEQYDIDVASKLRTHEITKEYFGSR